MSGTMDMTPLVEALRELSKGPGINSGERYMSLPAANKVLKPELARTAVSGLGDRLFPALKGTWDRLVRDYPVRTEDHRKLMSAGFKGGMLTIFNNIAATNLDADAPTLGALLKAQLFIHAHVERQREAFENCAWQERRETIEKYTLRGCGRPLQRSQNLCRQTH
uniref:Uncharacterized protein n=1 Tax=Rhodosorus marinus TaxID=101924 RepID=A0A7S0G1I2_9RHOD|mmetsp:Transcript_14578/g.21287  ORF Transcript_14578/g.21287 Transcript_14578/m.21287 type:complete len:165 (+) Transcript_14578:142-636(+)